MDRTLFKEEFMNYSLLSVSTVQAINIGDYIQALASRQFLPRVDSYIERERLKDYNGDCTNVIMNAYYMHDGSQWPPSEKINPLLVSVHVNRIVQDQMLSKEGIDYFKRHEPIGCRDLETMRVLKSHGIESYFSGCMTLTLGENYISQNKDGKVYFVDVNLPFRGRREKLWLLMCSFFHFSSVRAIYNKMPYNKHSLEERFGVWYKATKFYITFIKIAAKEVLINADFLTQEDESYNRLPDNDARMNAAEELVRKYARASLVITSRIHCALPCLAVQTPVYFVYNDRMPEHSKCRLDGLAQLLNVIHWTGKELVSDIGTISLEKVVPNRNDYMMYSKELIDRCKDFVHSCELNNFSNG